jgi:hypothetical protein
MDDLHFQLHHKIEKKKTWIEPQVASEYLTHHPTTVMVAISKWNVKQMGN